MGGIKIKLYLDTDALAAAARIALPEPETLADKFAVAFCRRTSSAGKRERVGGERVHFSADGPYVVIKGYTDKLPDYLTTETVCLIVMQGTLARVRRKAGVFAGDHTIASLVHVPDPFVRKVVSRLKVTGDTLTGVLEVWGNVLNTKLKNKDVGRTETWA